MNVNKRDHRDLPGGQRDAGQSAPRSGGRTTAQPNRRSLASGTGVTRAPAGRNSRAGAVGARGARQLPTEGSAALAPRPKGIERPVAPRLEVAPPPPFAVPRAPFAALVIAVVVGGVLGILLVNTKINENAIRLDKMRQQQAALDLRQQQLDEQIAEAEAPGNLVERARKLGLVDSGTPAFIKLPDGRKIGVPQPGGTASSDAGQQGEAADTGQQRSGD